MSQLKRRLAVFAGIVSGAAMSSVAQLAPEIPLQEGVYVRLAQEGDFSTSCAYELELDLSARAAVVTAVSNPETGVYCRHSESSAYVCPTAALCYQQTDDKIDRIFRMPDGHLVHQLKYPDSGMITRKYRYAARTPKKPFRFISMAGAMAQPRTPHAGFTKEQLCAAAAEDAFAEATSVCRGMHPTCVRAGSHEYVGHSVRTDHCLMYAEVRKSQSE